MFTLSALERLRLVLGTSAVVLWVVTIILDAIHPMYDPPPSIQLVILIVAGSLFAPTVIRKVNGTKK